VAARPAVPDPAAGQRAGRLIGVGTNASFEVRWQSPDLPSPTITTAPGKEGGAGWVLVELAGHPCGDRAGQPILPGA
jgi:hypothetical protein